MQVAFILSNGIRMRKSGFTLLEVLIALVILSVAFSAIFLALSASTKQLIYLRDKTAAQWVGLNAIAKVQLQQIAQNGSAEGIENQMQTNWHWQVRLTPTPDKNTFLITVVVTPEGRVTGSTTLQGYLFRGIQNEKN